MTYGLTEVWGYGLRVYPDTFPGTRHNRAHRITTDAWCEQGYRAPPDTQRCTDDSQYNWNGVLFCIPVIPLTGFLQMPAGQQPPLPFLSGGIYRRRNSGGDKREHTTKAHGYQDVRIIIRKRMIGLLQQGSCHIQERTYTIKHPHNISFFHFPWILSKKSVFYAAAL